MVECVRQFFLDTNMLSYNIFCQQIFGHKHFFNQNIFGPKNILGTKFFWPKFLPIEIPTKNSGLKSFELKRFLPTDFGQQILFNQRNI